MIKLALNCSLIAIAVLMSVLTSFNAMAQDTDLLTKQTVIIDNAEPEVVLNKVLADIRAVYNRYQPAVDSTTKLSKPKKVSGPANRPAIEMAFQKCLIGVCEPGTDFIGEVFIRESKGSCKRNFAVVTDLAKSGKLLIDLYKELNVDACFNINADGKGELQLVATAARTSTFSTGINQTLILKLLKLQAQPLVDALKETLRANGSK